MFQRFMPVAFTFLSSLLAAASHAQVDVTNVSLDVTVSRTSSGSDDVDVEFRVTGTGLDDGTLTQPIQGANPIALRKEGADLVMTDSLSNEAELAAFLPNGTYQLRINGGSVTAALVYTRPAVPSPAISSPNPGEVVPPGTVQIDFSACAVCNLVGDSVRAELEDAQGAMLDDETLLSSSVSWTPQGLAGPLQLPENESFLARVIHTAVRQANLNATDANGTLLFSHEFVQTDEVEFDTGFDRPEGHVCIAANYTAPPPGCTELSDVELQVLDPTGSFVAQIAGHDLEYTLAVAASGALTGTAEADLDDDDVLETSAPLRGRLRGTGGELRSRFAFALRNAALSAKLKVKQSEELSISGGSLTGTRRAKGAIGATKIDETTPTDAPLPFAPLGWLLEFDVAASGPVQNALLTLEGGRNFALTGGHKFKLGSGLSSFKLRSSDKKIRVGLSKLALDDATTPLTVDGGTLRTRILGQSAGMELP